MPQFHFISGLPRSGSTLLIGEEQYSHNFDNVEYAQDDFDYTLGIKGLHTVNRKVEFKPRRSILLPDLFQKYSEMAFWTDTSGSSASVISAKNK